MPYLVFPLCAKEFIQHLSHFFNPAIAKQTRRESLVYTVPNGSSSVYIMMWIVSTMTKLTIKTERASAKLPVCNN